MIRTITLSFAILLTWFHANAQNTEPLAAVPLQIVKQFPTERLAYDRPNPVYVDVENIGEETIHSVGITFVVSDGDKAQVFDKTFTDLSLAAGTHKRLRFSDVNVAKSDDCDVVVFLNKINDQPVALNEFGEPKGLVLSHYNGITSTSVDMTVFAEKFTSSTCGPCATWNSNVYTPLLAQLNFNEPGSGRTIAKNQVPIPVQGDPSVNSYSNGRRSVYSVSSAPSMYVQGTRVDYTGIQTFAQAADIFEDAVDDAASEPSFVTIDIDDVTITPLTNNQIEISVEGQIEALSNFGGQNIRLFIFVLNKDYVFNAAQNGDRDYKHVTRTILPSANGERVLNFNTGTVQAFNESVTLTNSNGVVPPNTTNLWNDRVEIVVVVQNRSNNDILQAAYANQFLSTDNAPSIADEALVLYPNPASEDGVLSFHSTDGGAAIVDVVAADGRTVFRQHVETVANEWQNVSLPVEHLESGMYIVRVHQNNHVSTRKWIIQKH
jgi:hypothetical protein